MDLEVVAHNPDLAAEQEDDSADASAEVRESTLVVLHAAHLMFRPPIT